MPKRSAKSESPDAAVKPAARPRPAQQLPLKAAAKKATLAAAPRSLPRLRFEPLTPKLWDEFEKLFGEKGACGGCWCMWPRRGSRDFSEGKGAPHKAAMKKLVAGGARPGILAFAEGEPIGWCAVAPREQYVRLNTSRVLKPLDDLPVWSVPCFYIAKGWRRRGVSAKLLEAAVRFAESQGATLVEGYPVEPYADKMPDAFAWVGLPDTFKKAGFKEAGRRSKSRPIMRRACGDCPPGRGAAGTSQHVWRG